MNVNISIDAMGGDFGPNVTIFVIRYLPSILMSQRLFFGDKSSLLTAIDKTLCPNFRSRLDIYHCESPVDCSDDKPSMPFDRNKTPLWRLH